MKIPKTFIVAGLPWVASNIVQVSEEGFVTFCKDCKDTKKPNRHQKKIGAIENPKEVYKEIQAELKKRKEAAKDKD